LKGSTLAPALGWLLLLVGTAVAQAPDGPADPDSSAGQFRQQGWGGPASPGATLAFDDEPKESLVGRVPIVHFRPWFEKKRRINERYGLQYGLSYQTVFAGASAGITPESPTEAYGGVLNIPISWTLNGDTGYKTVFTAAFESRHILGSGSVDPQNLAFETGTILPTAVKFNQFSFRTLVLHVGQQFYDGRIAIVVGKIALDDYFSHHQLMHPFMNYLGFGSVISPAGNWINPGFGIGGGFLVSEQIYVKAAVADVVGDPWNTSKTFLDFGSNFFEGRVQTMGEVGWVPSWDERYVKRMAISFWHVDAHDGFEEDWGAAWTSNFTVRERWVPFLLAGFSDGKAANALAEATVTVGTGYTFRSHDVGGASFNWNRPPGGLRDQYTVEGFYRFFLSERFAITPNLHWVIDPALNPAEDSILYTQLRLRVDI
jgi:porin